MTLLLRAEPIDGSARDAVASGQLLAIRGRDVELSFEIGDLFRRQLRFRAELHAGGFGAGNPFGGALLDEVTLELTDGGEHVK